MTIAYDPTKDPRYCAPGWTLIYPANGGHPYFVQCNPRKRRKPGRALRFAEARVGDVVLKRFQWRQEVHVPPAVPDCSIANDNRKTEVLAGFGLAIIEHRWFDPVAGEKDPTAGEMVAVRALLSNGPAASLTRHTLRGLASNGYLPLTEDQSHAALEWVAQRDGIMQRVDAGALTVEEARAIYRPWRMLLRDLGIEEA